MAKKSTEDARRLKRIDRCLKWFRKGLGETTVIDEFTAYWTALETLDSLIRPERRISLACKRCGRTVDKCSHCGEEIPPSKTAVNSLDGIRFIFENVGLENKLLNEIRGIRGGLLHGGKSFGDEERNFMVAQLSNLRRALIYGICHLLQIGDKNERVFGESAPAKGD
jgi:hypothetical protein